MLALPLPLIRQRLRTTVARLGIGWLFAAALIPGILAGSFLAYDVYSSERAQLEQAALQTARALAQALDRDLAGVEGKLQVLAASPALQAGDMQAFHSQAEQVLATETLASAIVLVGTDGQQWVNTLRPFGSPLPATSHPGIIRQAVESGRATVSDLFMSGIRSSHFVALAVPIKRGGTVAYILEMGIAADRINELLLAQNLPADWVAAVLDRTDTVVARSVNGQRFVGSKATPDLQARLRQSPEGSMASHTLEGTPSFVAFSRSPRTGWTLTVGMTRSVLYAKLYRPLAWAGLAILAFLVGGAALAWIFSRHVREGLQMLGAATEAATAGNLEATAPIGGPREIARLAEQFNRLQEARRKAEAEQRRLHRTLELVNDSNDTLLHAEDEQTLLPEICRLIVDKGGYLMAWVGFAEADAGKTVRPAASAGVGQSYLETVWVSWGNGEHGRGPVGEAIRKRQPQVVQDAATDPRMRPWRDQFRERGYQSSIALPLINDGAVIGALSIYAGEANAFAGEEISLLAKLAANLAFGIGSLRTRSQLGIANRELQSFTYAASHDMKAPLGRIVSFSTLLERNYRDRLEGDGLMFLDFIRQNATRLTFLIEDLLRHALIEQQSMHLEAVDLEAAVRAALQEEDAEIRATGARVEVSLPAATVLANPVALGLVLRNLLANALKYSAQSTPPRIEIQGRNDGKICCFWIKDNGIGFEMAYQERIFEIFKRLHSYAEYPGSGVGLALVKKAMERMGGRVWARGEPGAGATFFIELPLVRENRPEKATADASAAS